MAQQLVIVDAGVPGAVNSYYSEEKTLDAPGDPASPPVAAYTLVPEIGFIFFEALPATVSVVIRTSISPPVYTTLIAAGGRGAVWSDGSNIFVLNTDAVVSPSEAANYFVVAYKP